MVLPLQIGPKDQSKVLQSLQSLASLRVILRLPHRATEIKPVRLFAIHLNRVLMQPLQNEDLAGEDHRAG